ncbi:MAG TPA: NAD(P)H-binding protein [Sporichthyaceae bacterium]|jgi:uncharacterized protein YbjT (DUF2867 family)
MSEFLVIGGTGKTGKRVAAQLSAQGATARVGTRTPGAPGGREIPVSFEWDDTAGYKAALDGVDGVFMVPPTFRVDYVPLVEAFLAAAKSVNGPRVVFLSARGAVIGDHIPMRGAEQMLIDSGLEYTILRPSWFNQNFSEYFLLDAVRDNNMIPVPTGEGRTPFVDLDDVAAVAVAALTLTGHAGKNYDVTGPDSLSFGDTARILSDILDRDIAFIDLAPDAWKAAAIGAGMPADYAQLATELLGLVRSGGEDLVSGDVEEVLGRRPKSFPHWATSVAKVWQPA